MWKKLNWNCFNTIQPTNQSTNHHRIVSVNSFFFLLIFFFFCCVCSECDNFWCLTVKSQEIEKCKRIKSPHEYTNWKPKILKKKEKFRALLLFCKTVHQRISNKIKQRFFVVVLFCLSSSSPQWCLVFAESSAFCLDQLKLITAATEISGALSI